MNNPELVQWFVWLGFISLISLVLSILALPAILLRLPADYFIEEKRQKNPETRTRLDRLVRILKNLAGFVLVIAGILMLVLPGQGLLTLLAGLLLMNFPGKYQMERRLLNIRAVRRAVNWIRRKGGAPEFMPSGQDS